MPCQRALAFLIMLTRLWLPDLLCSASYWLLIIMSTLVAANLTSSGNIDWISAITWGGLLLAGLSPITTGLSWQLPSSLSRSVIMPLAYGVFAIGCLGLRWVGLDLLWSAGLMTAVGWAVSWEYCRRFKKIALTNTVDVFAIGFVAVWSGVVLVLLRPLLRSVAISLTGQGALLGWSDMVLLANFVLQLGAPASMGEPIPNPLLNGEAVLPYHFSSYVPAALAYRLGIFHTPLEAMVAIAFPLGLLLIGCSLAGVGQLHAWPRRLLGGVIAYTVTVTAYGAFLSYDRQSFWDPAWLLMTAPSTIHAAAMLSSFVAVYSQLSRSGCRIALIVLGWLLTLGMKIQVAWYTLPMYGALFFVSMLEFWMARKPPSQPTYRTPIYRTMQSVLALATGLLATALIMGTATELSGHGRDYIHDFVQFGSQVAQTIAFLEPLRTLLTVGPDMVKLRHLIPAAVSQGAIAGLSFWSGLIFVCILSWRLLKQSSPQRNARLCQAGITLLVGSFIATLFAPTTPWDASEFQNRAWPVLWIVAMQLWISGIAAPSSLPIRSQRLQLRLLSISLFLAVLATLLMIHQASRVGKSHIQTPLQPWSETFYPLQFAPQTLKVSAALQQPQLSAVPPFFVYPPDTQTTLNDQAAVLAALSGRLPYYSRLAMLNALQAIDDVDLSDLPTAVTEVLPTAQIVCLTLDGQIIRVELDNIGELDVVCLPLSKTN